MQWLLKKFLGTKNVRDLKKMLPAVAEINRLEESYQQLSEEQVKAKTQEFKDRLAQGETVDDILFEAFAAVKNACRRCMGNRYPVAGQEREWVEIPYDCQLIGGMAMHGGAIAEMATGEGKTLVACAPVYLNALAGRGVHVVTVNDFLASRDAQWMGHIYEWLGLTVGCIQHDMTPEEKRIEYNCDVTYGTNSEFGFDYLRDNMAWTPEQKVHRGYHYAIVDEIDSILIDEAKTPLIISGAAPNANIEQYARLKPAVQNLYKKQRKMCDELIQEAQRLLEKDEDEEAGFKLYQVGQGMPQDERLLKIIEEPSIRRLIEKTNNQMLTDMWKEKARELREELYFTIDEKGHDAGLTDRGCEAMSPDDPEMYELPDIITAFSDLDGDESLSDEERHECRLKIQEEYSTRSEDIHAIDQLIRAYCLYEKDDEYMVVNNEVIIIDSNTGRAMPGRRWSDGLHQAVEAKEGVNVKEETQTLATVTIQNYFRMYEKLAGMTGTAETEAEEFKQIYKLDVMVIPTNRPVRRVDFHDQIYKTRREKNHAVLEEITDCYNRRQPLLVGTVTVEASEELSRLLNKQHIPHNVLNAKFHQAESEVVARAGQPGAVTIATNMAGRGTDIKLGEGVVYLPEEVTKSTDFGLNSALSPEQREAFGVEDAKTLQDLLIERPCGLHVIATERHESRRIDRQLRGRCSRQGDPGSSRFYVSLEDDLMRLFGSDKISGIMEKLGLEEGEVLEHPWLNKSIERAQRRVEQLNFSRRKRTLEYDDVMNSQREIVYGFRSDVLCAEEVRPHIYDVVGEVIDNEADITLVDPELGAKTFSDWMNLTFPVGLRVEDVEACKGDAEQVKQMAFDKVKEAYELKCQLEDPEGLLELERHIVLSCIDNHWQEYLRAMDSLREGIHLVGFAQRDPLVEYKREAFHMFSDLMEKINQEITGRIFRMTTSVDAYEQFLTGRATKVQERHSESSAFEEGRQAQRQSGGQQPGGDLIDQALEKSRPVQRDTPKVGRNDPCPCGSGRKHKKCCGKS